MLTGLLRTLPSVYWLSPAVDKSMNPPNDQVYLDFVTEAGERKAYRTSQIPEHLANDIDDEKAATLMRYALSVATTTDPMVPVHCVFGYNVRTDVKIAADFTVTGNEPKYSTEL